MSVGPELSSFAYLLLYCLAMEDHPPVHLVAESAEAIYGSSLLKLRRNRVCEGG